MMNTPVMYGPKFAADDLPYDTKWYDHLSQKMPFDVPVPHQIPQCKFEELENKVHALTERVVQLENVIAGDGK